MFQTKNRRLYGAIVIVVLAVGAIFFSLFRGTDKSQSQTSSQSQQSQQTQQTQSQSSQNKGYIDSVAADDPYAKGIHHVRIVVKDYGTIELLTQTLRLLRSQILLILPSQASTMVLRSTALLMAS